MQAFDKGQEVHAMALPSYAEMLHNNFKSKKEGLNKKNTAGIMEKYGSAGEPFGVFEVVSGSC